MMGDEDLVKFDIGIRERHIRVWCIFLAVHLLVVGAFAANAAVSSPELFEVVDYSGIVEEINSAPLSPAMLESKFIEVDGYRSANLRAYDFQLGLLNGGVCPFLLHFVIFLLCWVFVLKRKLRGY